MKYICKRNCYVRNSKGTLQYFHIGDNAEYPEGSKVPDHFEPADSSLADGTEGEDDELKAELRKKLKELNISCSGNAGIETMRRKIQEFEAIKI